MKYVTNSKIIIRIQNRYAPNPIPILELDLTRFDLDLAKGQVPLRHVFVPKNYAITPIYSESASNSEYISV